jgi:hypothetical protein
MLPVRGPVSLVFVLVAVVAVFGFFALRLKIVEQFLPFQTMAALDDFGQTEETEATGGQTFQRVAVSADGPGKYLIDTPEGLRAEGEIAAMRGNLPVYIKDVITGYTTRVAQDVPAEIMTIRPISGCRLTPPLDGTEIGHVTGGQSGLDLGFATYSDAQLAAAVQVFVDTYRAEGSVKASKTPAPAYQVYDVAVTQTKAPVYLVLENASGNRIWNIHLAEGARIERVVLLGGDHAGVANLDPVVPVEVLPGEALAACGIVPAYRLNASHTLFGAVKNGAMTQDQANAELAAVADAVTAYDIWFRDNFGILANESRAGFDVGTISVVGPVPRKDEPKASYAPIHAAKIRATQGAFFEIKGQVAEGEDFASRVKAIATTFAFDDLNYLRQGVSF